PLFVAGAAADGAECGAALARCVAQRGTAAVRAVAVLLRTRFSRARAWHLAEHRATDADDLAGRVAAEFADVRAGRRRDHDSGGAELYRVFVSGVSRQSGVRIGLSLKCM